MDKQEIIKKLEELDSLLTSKRLSEQFLSGVGARIYAKRHIDLRRKANALPKAPDACTHLPVVPADGLDSFMQYEEPMNKKGKLLKMTLIGVVACFVLNWVFLLAGVVALSGLLSFGMTGCIVASVVLFLQKSGAKQQYEKGKKVYDKAMEVYEKSLGEFRGALAVFEKQRDDALAMLVAHEMAYEEMRVEDNRIEEEYVQKYDEAETKLAELEDEIATYDFVPAQYHHLVERVLTNLKSGRADDYKEALNLAIFEEKDEQERAARMAEEARRTELAEQRADEERRHNEQMEAQQAAHNQAMQAQAARAEENRQKEARAAQRSADRAAQAGRQKRCIGCAHQTRCSIKHTDGAYNCTGFTPR